MKVALLLSGQMRTLDQCAPSLMKYIVEPIKRQADVVTFVHAAADTDAHKAYDVFPDAQIEIEDQPTLDEKNYVLRAGKGVCGVQSVLRQLWEWRQVWRMAEGDDFELAVRLRSDSFYYNEIEPPETWHPEGLYVPRFSSFWGLCDRFAFGGRGAMGDWHCLWDDMDEMIADGHPLHPESLVENSCQSRIYRTNVLFSTVRSDGEIRTPQFIRSIGDVPFRPPLTSADVSNGGIDPITS